MADLFISYSSQDTVQAESITRYLRSCGISCWMAPNSIPTGSSYASEITRALRECKVLLLVLSANAQNSIWVPKEVGSALNFKKTVMPVAIEACALNDEFSFYLQDAQILNISEVGAYERLVGQIRSAISASKGEIPAFEAPQPPQSHPQPQKPATFCIHCGARNTAGSLFCIQCGSSMDQNAPARQVPRQGSPKNRILALILCLFLGWAGVHRFYVKKNGTAVLYLFTLGLFYVGWLFDFICILRKSFTDASGQKLL